MRYAAHELKAIFPQLNFIFLQHKVLKQVLRAVEGRLVGGVVRDGLLNISSDDMDISTPHEPDKVVSILQSINLHPIPTGIKYGTVSLFLKGLKIEITSLRKDVETYGRKALVSFGGSWEEDSLRRDFTFNALFLELKRDTYFLYDYHKGIEDLKNGKVKFIGDYRERIKEDYLRILRFIRFFLRYSKSNDYMKEIDMFREFIPHMKILSVERVIMEINAILKCENWCLGIEMMNELRISQLFFGNSLYIPSQNKSTSRQEKFYIIFNSIAIEVINRLPLNKSIKSFLQYYKRTDFSIKSLALLWHRSKSLNLLREVIQLGLVLNISVNLKLSNLNEENFNQFKTSYAFQHHHGVMRGLEELNLKEAFLLSLSNEALSCILLE